MTLMVKTMVSCKFSPTNQSIDLNSMVYGRCNELNSIGRLFHGL